MKKSLGGLYILDITNKEEQEFTFVYKRTMHETQGIAIKSNEVL